jgi:hypothetical protein
MSKTESAENQIKRLGAFIMDEVPNEPSRTEGAVDVAIRIIRTMRAKENERTVFGILQENGGRL